MQYNKLKLKTCKRCGSLFTPTSSNYICDDCKLPRTATINNCKIVETFQPGRCLENIKGECENCLDFCAEHGWVGWRKESDKVYQVNNKTIKDWEEKVNETDFVRDSSLDENSLWEEYALSDEISWEET